MQKSATLIRKHFNPSRTSLALLAFAGLLFTSRPAAAQTTAPLKFVSPIAYHSEAAKETAPSLAPVKEDGEDIPVSISVSPNPTTAKFLVSLKGNREDRVRIRVTDRHGCVVDSHELSGGGSLQLGYWYFPGTYLMHITQGDNTKTIKLEKRLE